MLGISYAFRQRIMRPHGFRKSIMSADDVGTNDDAGFPQYEVYNLNIA